MVKMINPSPEPLCRHCVHVRTRLTVGGFTQRVCGKAGKAHQVIDRCPFWEREIGADDDKGACHVG